MIGPTTFVSTLATVPPSSVAEGGSWVTTAARPATERAPIGPAGPSESPAAPAQPQRLSVQDALGMPHILLYIAQSCPVFVANRCCVDSPLSAGEAEALSAFPPSLIAPEAGFSALHSVAGEREGWRGRRGRGGEKVKERKRCASRRNKS